MTSAKRWDGKLNNVSALFEDFNGLWWVVGFVEYEKLSMKVFHHCWIAKNIGEILFTIAESGIMAKKYFTTAESNDLFTIAESNVVHQLPPLKSSSKALTIEYWFYTKHVNMNRSVKCANIENETELYKNYFD